MKGAIAKSGNITIPPPEKSTFNIPKLSQPSKTDYFSTSIPRDKRGEIKEVMDQSFVDTMKKAAPYANWEQFKANVVELDPSLESSIDSKVAGLNKLISRKILQW